MNVTKIIYFISAPFNRRDYKRFGVDIFIKDGFEVYVWDFTPLLYPKIYMKVIPPDPITYRNLTRFYKKEDAVKEIRKEKNEAFLINLISYQQITFSLFRAISKWNIPYCVSIPNIPIGIPEDKRRSLLRKIRSINIRKLIYYCLLKIPPKCLGIKPAIFCFLGGKKSLTRRPEIDKKTQLIWIHTYDYDIYLKNSKEITINTAVFIDKYFPFHPDYLFQGRKFKNPKDYYPLLNQFFDHVEEKLKLEVVIAAHPRSHYDELPDFFHERRVIRGKTDELIRNAKCVILHSSTAISFCVLYKKPMIFITSDELNKHSISKRTEVSASYFGKTPINISGNLNVDLERELIVDDNKYSKYKRNYIKIEGAEELPFWQIVSNRIKELNY